MMKKINKLKTAFIFFMIMLLLASKSANAQVEIHGANAITDGTTYATLKDAFNATNTKSNRPGRDIEVRINACVTDDNGARLNERNWNSLTIFPTVAGVDLSEGGDNSTWAIISLYRANKVTIDGKVNRKGDEPSLTIKNNGTARGHVSVEFLNLAQFSYIEDNVIYNNSSASKQAAGINSAASVIGIVYLAAKIRSWVLTEISIGGMNKNLRTLFNYEFIVC